MNDESARQGAPDDQPTALREYHRALTPLMEYLVTLYLLLEDARDELRGEAWRAFVWIACDRIGEEAARLMVAEALDATEEAA